MAGEVKHKTTMTEQEWENLITEEAAKWFPDCEDILVWRWNESDAGECHPLAVVRAWEETTRSDILEKNPD